MAENTVEISQVPPDINPVEIGKVHNPLKQDFTHRFNGKRYVIPAEGYFEGSLPAVAHLAKHLAEYIIRKEYKDGIIRKYGKDEDKLARMTRKAIPNYRKAIFQKMQELVETNSDFFSRDDAERKAIGGKLGNEPKEEEKPANTIGE